MSRRVERFDPVPYPVDRRGFPVAVDELNLPFMVDNKENLHHLNYYRRLFASTAISQTFRDLASFQEMMPVNRHEELHKRYTGIKLPPKENMLERIEEAWQAGEKLRVRTIGGYVLHDISYVHLQTLKAEYNDLRYA